MPDLVSQEPTRRSVAVVGVNGFVGSHVALTARLGGSSFIGVARKRPQGVSSRLHRSFGLADMKILEGDARDATTTSQVIKDFRPDVLIVTAGVTRSATSQWLGEFAANYQIAAATVDAVSNVESEHQPFVVWVGSQAEYGTAQPPWSESSKESPATGYGTSKLIGSTLIEGAARAGALRGCVVRVPIVFGPGQSPSMLVSEAICSSLAGTRLRMTAGEQTRRLVYAPDLASALLEIGARGRTGTFPTLVNSPAYDPIQIRTVAELASEFLPGLPSPEIGAIPYRPAELMDAWPATELATSLGLLVKTPIGTAMEKTVKWYKANKWFWEGGADE
jgi:nucleoside-diphosphate-sugar epimerase